MANRGLRSLAFAAVLAATAGRSANGQATFRPSLDFGRYGVGFRAVELLDSTRHIGDRVRPVAASMWYPAHVGMFTDPMRYEDYLELFASPGELPAHDADGKHHNAESLARAFNPTDLDRLARERSTYTHAVRDARAEAGPFPVIVYGASFNAPSFENALLMEFLSSHGYIVLAVPSVGANGPQTSDFAGVDAEARDMQLLLRYARTVPGADTMHLAAMGFSWGGTADVIAAIRDTAVRALVSLDGSIASGWKRLAEQSPDLDPARFGIPALFFRQRSAPMSDSSFQFYNRLARADAYVVHMETIAHQNFGEWFDRLQQRDNPTFVADMGVAGRGYERVARYTLAFFDAYLKQSADALAFLRASPDTHGMPAREVRVEMKLAR